MSGLDIDAIRREVRALDYVRGSSAEAALWREDDADARANLAIEGMALEPDDDALFDMLREEAGDCQDFRVWPGIMGNKESHYVTTQRTCHTE